jgi:hypothetical protein
MMRIQDRRQRSYPQEDTGTNCNPDLRLDLYGRLTLALPDTPLGSSLPLPANYLDFTLFNVCVMCLFREGRWPKIWGWFAHGVLNPDLPSHGYLTARSGTFSLHPPGIYSQLLETGCTEQYLEVLWEDPGGCKEGQG